MTLVDICIDIDCQGVGENCPGDSQCNIIRKIIDSKDKVDPKIIMEADKKFWELVNDTE
jgi:hypothetical protein